MLDIFITPQFREDYKKTRLIKETCFLFVVIDLLRNEKPLPEKYRDHSLSPTKDYKGMRECHISPDWLLDYQIDNNKLILIRSRIPKHSELF